MPLYNIDSCRNCLTQPFMHDKVIQNDLLKLLCELIESRHKNPYNMNGEKLAITFRKVPCQDSITYTVTTETNFSAPKSFSEREQKQMCPLLYEIL